MKIYLLLSLTIFAVACSSLPKKRTDKLSILQGLTTEKEVEFNVLVPKSKSLSYELRSAEGIILKPEEVKVVNEPSSPWEIHKLLFLRDQAKEFNLYVYEKNKIIDQRLIGKGQIGESKIRLAVISCINDGYSKHFKIWDALANKNPEYVLMVGDNVYGNREATGSPIESNPENLWRRYTDMRLTVPFYFQQKLIPVHAVWDDNDYGSKDAGEEYEFKRQSKEIFDSFFAQSLSDESFTKSFGVGGKLSLGDFNLYFLDARYFRSHSTDGGHLGKDQHQWLVNSLKEESQPSFIIKGDQFFGGYHSFDSYEGRHPKDFENFVKDLKSIGTPVIFLSGDRHMSEIMQFPRSLFGLPSFEITSSPIHSRVYEDSEIKNPWRVVHTNGKMNFVYIENLAEDNHWFLDVENIGENGEVYFKRELAVYIKDLQNNLNQVRKRRHGRRRYHKHRSRIRKK
jgi:alkaline phosphatase D